MRGEIPATCSGLMRPPELEGLCSVLGTDARGGVPPKDGVFLRTNALSQDEEIHAQLALSTSRGSQTPGLG